MGSLRARRTIVIIFLLLIGALPLSQTQLDVPTLKELIETGSGSAEQVPENLAALQIKGRAPKTGYERSEFGDGWANSDGCDTRNRILARDLKDVVFDENCKILSGNLDDPYTGKTIAFMRGETTSDDVQIDHVVALSNAWQTGAQQLTYTQRVALANDPLNLIAVDGPANEQKSDGDAATWLPPNKAFRCDYVSRQVAVKSKYSLWVTRAEHDAIARELTKC